jgi:CheY-like chemotaxis protein
MSIHSREGIAGLVGGSAGYDVGRGSGLTVPTRSGNFPMHRPDVTLMDLQMSEMNYLDALIAFRTEFPDARVIVLTTYEGDVHNLRALKAGAQRRHRHRIVRPDGDHEREAGARSGADDPTRRSRRGRIRGACEWPRTSSRRYPGFSLLGASPRTLARTWSAKPSDQRSRPTDMLVRALPIIGALESSAWRSKVVAPFCGRGRGTVPTIVPETRQNRVSGANTSQLERS